MPARTFISRILPVAAITAGLPSPLPPARPRPGQDEAGHGDAALGDKRREKTRLPPASQTEGEDRRRARPCARTPTLLPSAENVELVRAAILCLHNQIPQAEKGLPSAGR